MHTQSQDKKSKYVPTAAGRRLQRARVDAGFARQTDLADASGVGALTINRIEKGRGPLTAATARRLAPHVRRSEAWLLYGVEESAATTQPTPVVEQYLTTNPWGRDVSPHVAKLLRELDFSSIGVANPTAKDVHRAREVIEINLAIAAQRRR